MSATVAPVIAIDGPSGSGKGTVAARVAERLGWHYLDSGALYRLTALAARQQGVAWDDADALSEVATRMVVHFDASHVWLNGQPVDDAIRTEAISAGASRVAVCSGVRQALLQFQRDFCRPPGLVGDGRDLGSVVFPDATLKIFLTASPEVRADRRVKQLIDKGISAIFPEVLRDINERDARDRARTLAPLQQLPDAVLLDTTHLSIDQAVDFVLKSLSDAGS